MVARHGATKTLTLLVLLLAPMGPSRAARADENDPGVTYVVDPNQVVQAESHVTSNIPGWSTGLDISTFLGANRFYNAGITGQNTIAANVEAGHIWNGHQSLDNGKVTELYTPANALGDYDRHATWVGMMIGGNLSSAYGRGMAPSTDLRSGAIASSWSGTPYSTSFSLYYSAMFAAYDHFFGTADVINSSWGSTDATGTSTITVAVDGFAYAHPQTTMVCSAGNSGPGENSVGGPGSGYNAITVGALGNANSYDTVSSFSSRGPQDYKNAVGGTTSGVRAAVDIVAPGESLVSAYYGGATGGNTGGTADGGPGYYSSGLAGTSFAAPIVAGGVALLDSASKAAGLGSPSRDSRVIKSVMLNSADKITGWDNGQSLNGNDVVTTTQSLDWNLGAGRMNLDKAYDQYLSGTEDVSGVGGGDVQAIGWDYARLLSVGANNQYVFSSALKGGEYLDVTLSWFRDRSVNVSQNSASDISFADLDLQIWDANFQTLYAQSISDYNSVELLHFLLPQDGDYGLRILYQAQRFGSVTGEYYGLAWAATAVPEPGTLVMLFGIATMWFACHRRKLRLIREPS